MKKSGAPKKRDKILALSEAEGAAALEDRYAFNKDKDIEFDEHGNFSGGKRSQFEGRKNVAFGGGIGTASYGTKNYSTKGWSGNTAAGKKMYEGSTDGSRFQTASQFQGTSATQMAQRSRFEGSNAPTSRYKTRKANETTRAAVEKPTDGWTDFRRRVYPKPLIMSEADYKEMTVEQTRSILGRDD